MKALIAVIAFAVPAVGYSWDYGDSDRIQAKGISTQVFSAPKEDLYTIKLDNGQTMTLTLPAGLRGQYIKMETRDGHKISGTLN